jgi:hypothetical protein
MINVIGRWYGRGTSSPYPDAGHPAKKDPRPAFQVTFLSELSALDRGTVRCFRRRHLAWQDRGWSIPQLRGRDRGDVVNDIRVIGPQWRQYIERAESLRGRDFD